MIKHKQNISAFFFSVLVLLTALSLLWLAQFSPQIMTEKVMVRAVATIALPPPPPPPPAITKAMDAPLTVKVGGAGATMQLAKLTVNSVISIKPPTIPTITMSAPSFSNDAINWDAFSLDDLDALPQLLTSVKAKLPKSLAKQAPHSFMIKLEVLIDEQGQVSLIEVIANPYPELKPEIDRIVRHSRFSAPKKDQQTVRARFIWPIKITP